MTSNSAPGRRRILFLAEGATMTHFVRPLVLADSLNADQYEIFFRTPSRYHRFLKDKPFHVGDLQAIDPAVFLKLMSRGKRLYSANVLRSSVADDLRLLRQYRPDLVIGDFRLSLAISASIEPTPFATVFSAYWSRFARQEMIMPETPLSRRISPALLAHIFRLLCPAILRYHAKPINQVRQEFHLPPIPGDIRDIYMCGDLVFYPDVPEFIPTTGAPSCHHYIGPCLWTLPAQRPDWWDAMVRDPSPKVFVSMGSSGSHEVLPNLYRALEALPVKVVLATSGRQVPAPPDAYVADLLPFEETARQARVVVSHGGISALYPSLAVGVPSLGIPSNPDAHLSAALLERSGAGLRVRSEWATPERLREALEALLNNPSYRKAASAWPAMLARSDTRRLFPEILRRFFSEKQ